MATRGLMLLVLAGGIATASPSTGWSQRFPRVYGATGHTYGPTQANYQYQRQYGRPWHGYGGALANQPRQHNVVVNSPYFPVYYGQAFPYNPWFSSTYPVPVAPVLGLSFYSPGVYGSFGVVTGNPGVYVPDVNHDLARQGGFLTSPLEDAWRDNEERWGRNLPDVRPNPVTRPVVPSTAAARLKSVEAQSRGDEHLRKQEWQLAYIDYKQAVEAAEDRGEAHLRLGLVLLVLQHYDSAALSLKRAIHHSPELATSAPSLTELLGHDSALTRNSVAHRLIEYVGTDIRDPDRLFLLGMYLHLDGDPRAREVFESGLRLAGRGEHFAAFLTPATPPATPLPANTDLPPAPLPNAAGPGATFPVGPALPAPTN